MFSHDIISSDHFLDMGQGAQVLYFHLAMRADDDGFVNPKSVMRMLGIADDELKVLIAKRFLLPFESGVVVVKHWLIHNLIRADLYKETQYKKEKSTLGLNENGAYTELLNESGQPRIEVAEIKQIDPPKWLKLRRKDKRTANVPQTARRIGKDRIGKVSKEKKIVAILATGESNTNIPELIKAFESINPACKKFYANKTQRGACENLINAYGFEKVKSVIENVLPKTNTLAYFPTITTPLQLFEKWSALEIAIKKHNNKTTSVKEKQGVAYW